jgi:hypothetical protein|tara:strand:+ start:7744 stop:8034 length:291 start_codon:yes stop_codon:yes gene_type:complete
MLFGRNVTFRLLDQFVFEQFGPEGIRSTLVKVSRSSQDLQNGFIPNYAALFFYGLLSLILILVVMPKLAVLVPVMGIFSNALMQIVPVLSVLFIFS